MRVYLLQGCEPYRVPPCPRDEEGKSACAGKPREKNHRCTRMCYGNQDLDYGDDHRYSENYFEKVYYYFLNYVFALFT